MKATDFKKLVASVKQASRIRRGQLRAGRVTRFKPADVRAIRERLGVTQAVSPATLRKWEQGRRVPDGPAQALLRVAAANPEAVAIALSA